MKNPLVIVIERSERNGSTIRRFFPDRSFGKESLAFYLSLAQPDTAAILFPRQLMLSGIEKTLVFWRFLVWREFFPPVLLERKCLFLGF
jgi:hypothetical protein